MASAVAPAAASAEMVFIGVNAYSTNFERHGAASTASPYARRVVALPLPKTYEVERASTRIDDRVVDRRPRRISASSTRVEDAGQFVQHAQIKGLALADGGRRVDVD